jgi:hypothetical protein
MLIYDDEQRAILLDSIYNPTPTEYMWVLDLNMMDFTLAPLTNLEEIIGSSIELMINGFRFHVPGAWNILTVSEETSQLDVIAIKDVLGKEFTALAIGMTATGALKYHPFPVVATDFKMDHMNVAPQLGKHQMLCHPIGPTSWVNIAPSDTYNKYFKDAVVGDII